LEFCLVYVVYRSYQGFGLYDDYFCDTFEVNGSINNWIISKTEPQNYLKNYEYTLYLHITLSLLPLYLHLYSISLILFFLSYPTIIHHFFSLTLFQTVILHVNLFILKFVPLFGSISSMFYIQLLHA